MTAALAALALAAAPHVLVQQLGSPEFPAREAASRRLDALGGVGLPALTAAAAVSADAEVRARADVLSARISRREENARLTAPTLVTLAVSDAPFVDVIAEIEAQSGYRFYFAAADAGKIRAKRVTVNTRGPVPFWDAVDVVCGAAGLCVTGVGLPPSPVPRGRFIVPADDIDQRQPAPPRTQFVPVVPDAPEDRVKAAADRKARENAAADLAAVTGLIQGLEKKAAAAARLPAPAANVPAAFPVTSEPTPPKPAGPGVYLEPAAGSTLPRAAAGIARVELVPPTVGDMAFVSDDTIPLTFRVIAEPKLSIVGVAEVRFVSGFGSDGRPLESNLIDPPFEPKPTTAVLGFGRRGGGYNPPTPIAPVASGTLRLRAYPGRPIDRVTNLSGVLVVTTRMPPGEAVAVTDFSGTTAGRGEAGTTLHVVAQPPDDAGRVRIILTATYNVSRFSPVFDRVPGMPEMQSGYRLTDAAGRAYGLSVLVTRTTVRIVNGDRIQMRTATVTATPPDGAGPPARLGFYGVWHKTLEIPFNLPTGPASAGTLKGS